MDDENDFPGNGSWDHMAVRHPSGLIIDAEGVHNEDDFYQKWKGLDTDTIATVKPKNFAAVVQGVHSWGSLNSSEAAGRILAEIEHA